MWGLIIRNIDLKIALGGWSPIDWINQIAYPENFENNFPSGIEIFEKSAFMHIYKLAFFGLGIPTENTVYLVIALEIFLLASAIYCLSRTLLPSFNELLHIILVLLVVSSYAREMNFARFAQTYFAGHYYNVADALRIFAIVMILKKKPVESFLLLSGSIACHFLMGLTGALFILGMLTIKHQESLKTKYLLGYLIFLCFSGFWVFVNLEPSKILSSQIPNDAWINLTRLNNSHWYPYDSGIFTVGHQNEFIPFLSFVLLFSFYFHLFRSSSRNEMPDRILAGMIMMAMLVTMGIIFSIFSSSPILIKLSLHRANDLIITVGMIYIIAGLFKELNSPHYWRRIFSMADLLFPFFIKPGFPVFISLALANPSYLRLFKNGSFKKADLITFIVAASIVLLLVIYGINGMLGTFLSDAYVGINTLLRAFLKMKLSGIASFIIGVFFLIAFRKFYVAKSFKLFLCLIFFASATVWLFNTQIAYSEKGLAKDYRDAQIWARQNTPPRSLFMVDPTIYYGWRDFSQRASFGNLREWIHTSWAYSHSFENYQEGMRRFEEFSIDLNRYIAMRPISNSFSKLHSAVREKYYVFDHDFFLTLAKKYGINYFLFNKEYNRSILNMPIVFENRHFMICSSE